MPTMYKSKPKRKKVQSRLPGKPKAQKRELGDFENVKEGSVEAIDGVVLFLKGFFKLLGFAISTMIDGIKWMFDKGDKPKQKKSKRS